MDMKKVGCGAVLGALIGDAAGATLEFTADTPDREDAKQALSLVGGGHWGTAPGQITDDGEMTLCLMSALAGTKRFSIEKVARAYLRWFRSVPFDMGETTRNGLGGGFGKSGGSVHAGMWRAAEELNQSSKANGALMRVAPLGVWGHRLSEKELCEAAFQDCRLTHCNKTCQHASAIYCLAIRHLMHHPGDSEGAFSTAQSWATRIENPQIIEWLDYAEQNVDVGYTPSSGFVKYAFAHSFRHLKLRSSFLDALLVTLMGGGDTDTNACIVGGLVGALHGEDGIPKPLINLLLNCDTKRGRPRPEFLQPGVQLPQLLGPLID
jgi:ADP-ribosyl-[dinitrogen reductase] hydrolase